MAVSFVDGAVSVYETDAATGPQTTWNLPVPAALVAGDFLVFSMSLDIATTTSPVFTSTPAGSSALIPMTVVSGSSTSNIAFAVYTKFVTAGEVASPPANYVFVLDAAYDGTFSTSRFRGVDTVSPFAISTGNVGETRYTSTTNNSKVSPSVTTTVGSTMLVAGSAHRSGSSTLTSGDPVGYTRSVNGYGIGGRAHAVAYAPQAATGASTTATWRLSSGGVGNAWQTALRPVAAAGGAAPNKVLVGTTWTAETPRVLNAAGTWVPDVSRPV